MDANQIQLLKQTHMLEAEKEDGSKTTLGAYMRFCLDGGIDFVTSKDLVVFDDTNNMLHCVAINEDGRTQANYPVKVISTDYGIVQQVECIYSQKNFEKMLEEGFMSTVVSEEKRKAMISWSRNIRNQAIQPSRSTPYYTTDPTVIPMPNTSMSRINEVLDKNTEENDASDENIEMSDTPEENTEIDNTSTEVTEDDGVSDEVTGVGDTSTEGTEGNIEEEN